MNTIHILAKLNYFVYLPFLLSQPFIVNTLSDVWLHIIIHTQEPLVGREHCVLELEKCITASCTGAIP